MVQSAHRRIRVGLDQRLAAYRTAGIARYALELGHALSRIPKVEVVPLRHARDETPVETQVRLRTPPHHRFEERLLGLEFMIRRIRFDIYHATDFITPHLRKTPSVATVHDLAFMRWPDQLSSDALAYYRRLLDRRGDTARWITPSEWTRNDLCELAGVNRSLVSVIPHGVSSFVDAVGVVPRAQRRPYIVAVGTVEPRKRYDLLLDAIASLEPSPELCLVGQPGWNTEELQKRLQTTPGVTWLRNATDQEVRRLLAGAMALAVPSLAEGFGLGALEAMACGTPVVSSGHAALSEVTGDVAITPATDDADGWTDALRAALTDSFQWERASLAGVGRSHVFSWDRAAAETLRVYEMALD